MSDPTVQNLPDDESESDLERKQGLLDKFRGTGVGVEDPNIVGDPGPDVPTDDDDPGLAPGRSPETEPPGA